MQFVRSFENLYPDQQHIRVPYMLSDKLSSWLPPLLALLLISDGGTRRTTESNLTDIFFNKNSNIFACTADCPATLTQDFYCRNELLATNRIDKFSAPSGASQRHTRGPYKLSDKLSSWLPPLLALILISDRGPLCTTKSILAHTLFKKTRNIFSCRPDCLAILMHLLLYRPTRGSRFTL